MKATLIPHEYVDEMWSKVKPHLEKAAEYTYGRFDVDDIHDQIMQYDHALWVAYEGKDIKGAVVTVVTTYPRMQALTMVFAGGEELKNWKEPMLEILQKFAATKECDVIESTGRPGWAKIFKDDGYRVTWLAYELPIGG